MKDVEEILYEPVTLHKSLPLYVNAVHHGISLRQTGEITRVGQTLEVEVTEGKEPCICKLGDRDVTARSVLWKEAPDPRRRYILESEYQEAIR